MTKPDYDSSLTGRKVEEILLDRLTDMFSALQMRHGSLFDESCDWVEYLLSWETDSYKELILFKDKLKYALKLSLVEVYLASKPIENVLAQRRYKKQQKVMLEWQYRRDYLKKVIEIFFKRQILQYRKTTYASLTGVDIRELQVFSDDENKNGEGSKGNTKEHPLPQ